MDTDIGYAGPVIMAKENLYSVNNSDNKLSKSSTGVIILGFVVSIVSLIVSVAAVAVNLTVLNYQPHQSNCSVEFPLNGAPTTTSEPANSCAPNYEHNPYSNTCLQLVNIAKSWKDAKSFCEERGEHLATFESLESAYWFLTLRKTKSTWRSPFVWVGGKRTKGNIWKWQGRSERLMVAVPWGRNEPNNHNGTQDCMNSDVNKDYKFDDTDCANAFPFFCELHI